MVSHREHRDDGADYHIIVHAYRVNWGTTAHETIIIQSQLLDNLDESNFFLSPAPIHLFKSCLKYITQKIDKSNLFLFALRFEFLSYG